MWIYIVTKTSCGEDSEICEAFDTEGKAVEYIDNITEVESYDTDEIFSYNINKHKLK
jgi:hypothetical protein